MRRDPGPTLHPSTELFADRPKSPGSRPASPFHPVSTFSHFEQPFGSLSEVLDKPFDSLYSNIRDRTGKKAGAPPRCVRFVSVQ